MNRNSKSLTIRAGRLDNAHCVEFTLLENRRDRSQTVLATRTLRHGLTEQQANFLAYQASMEVQCCKNEGMAIGEIAERVKAIVLR